MSIRKITTFAFISTIAAPSVWFSACDRVSQIAQPITPQMGGGELSIGVVLPLTGRRTDSFGVPMSQGFELARNEINNAQPMQQNSISSLWTVEAA